MYDRRLETVLAAKQEHDENQRAAAAKRMKDVGIKRARIRKHKKEVK